ncbi:1-acyl-sn-glycerol-3-phosphate acyltransferase [Jatrophihabitans telluris]|uniref:1-acyl-sn-glycerol-3-phosphate acyltransferase n=1 Tax=Jatrophihabitans telluris TaxID=2038343 RepID=A0ABY4R1Z3_9ACTN|nr:lysophospholipid acyltransferase family protein [Jatrophihabitans telluris]UQX89958.1 1-acyl-sn-glycerol-3-phosphate acyltransferase [Jatrophihabitans telluris]
MFKRMSEKPGPYLRFCVIVFYPLISLAWRRRWIGSDRIPRRGPAILAINHISYADPFVIARLLWDIGRLPRFLAKSTIFHVPVIGRVVANAGQIPVYRGTADAAAALQGAVQALERGEIVLIYPEGTVTRDPDFWPMQAKSGTARLALLAPDVPVIPVGQWGSQEFLDFYARRFRPLPRKTVTVAVGAPLDLSRYRGRPPTAALLHEMTDEIMGAVTAQVAVIRGQNPPAVAYPSPWVGSAEQGMDRQSRGESA